MTVETTTTVVWTCDVAGCKARYEGEPPLGGSLPVGFAAVEHRQSVVQGFDRSTSGVFCADHAAHVAMWLEGVRKGRP